jgi:3-methyladenine DNA glycosylase AlkD
MPPQPSPKTLEAQIVASVNALPTLDATSIRNLRRQFSRELKAYPGKAILELAFKLLQRSGFAYRFIAYELIYHHHDAMALIGPRQVARLSRGMASWGHVDTFAYYISGPAWALGQIDDELILRWTKSCDRWQRRAALVSTIPLCRSDARNYATHLRIIGICIALIDDRDPMVVKALSWALRELTKHAPAVVERLVQTYNARLPALVRREVTNKLVFGLKNPKPRRTAKARQDR